MIINIQALITSKQLDFEGEQNVSLKEFNLGTQKTDYMAKVYGEVIRNGTTYIVSGTLDVTIKMVCDRCMVEYDYPIHTTLYSAFSSGEIAPDESEDVKPVIKSSIDLSDSILEAIAMEIPMKSLCLEDCKGICTMCGTNLNRGTCECAQSDIDPRLEKLQSIFCQ